MRSSMAFPIRFWSVLLAFLLIYQFSTEASADWCKYEKEIDLTLDLSGSNVLVLNAAAGDLEVRGVSGSDKAVIHGKLCVSKKDWLDEAEVQTITGERAEINIKLPDTNGGWSIRFVEAEDQYSAELQALDDILAPFSEDELASMPAPKQTKCLVFESWQAIKRGIKPPEHGNIRGPKRSPKMQDALDILERM